MLKINCERSERKIKIEKNLRFGHKQVIGPRPLGGGAGCPTPPDPLVRVFAVCVLLAFLSVRCFCIIRFTYICVQIKVQVYESDLEQRSSKLHLQIVIAQANRHGFLTYMRLCMNATLFSNSIMHVTWKKQGKLHKGFSDLEHGVLRQNKEVRALSCDIISVLNQ